MYLQQADYFKAQEQAARAYIKHLETYDAQLKS